VIGDIILLYSVAIAYYAIWSSLKSRTEYATHLLFIFSFVLLFTLGFIFSENYSEVSRIGNGILFLAPIVFLAPMLEILRKFPSNEKYKIPIIVLTPITGAITIFLLLLITNQIG